MSNRKTGSAEDPSDLVVDAIALISDVLSSVLPRDERVRGLAVIAANLINRRGADSQEAC